MYNDLITYLLIRNSYPIQNETDCEIDRHIREAICTALPRKVFVYSSTAASKQKWLILMKLIKLLY